MLKSKDGNTSINLETGNFELGNSKLKFINEESNTGWLLNNPERKSFKINPNVFAEMSYKTKQVTWDPDEYELEEINLKEGLIKFCKIEDAD